MRPMRWRAAVAAAAIGAVAVGIAGTWRPTLQAGAQTQSAAAQAPRLIVLIVIDQMRADYVERFRGSWSGGLERIVDQGAWFTNAAYPYLTTVTCPGHATLATGAFPRTHGIFQNAWFDRIDRRLVYCTDDPRIDAVTYDGRHERGGQSAFRLRLPTFADEMRYRRGARVVALALKPRSAVVMAGNGGEAVTWMDDDTDRWETSSRYSPRPVPEVKRFLDANPIHADFGKVWQRLLPAARYPEADDMAGESPPAGWTATFPHVLRGTAGKPDASFVTQWERSPFADAYIGRMAAALAADFRLGQRETTDVLIVGFSAPDMVGHRFGPHSQEIRDQYAHLDRTMGALLDRLDVLVGAGNFTLALSADHGVTTIPEQIPKAGKGGRVNAARLTALIDQAAQIAGEGRYVSRIRGNEVYFEPGMYDKLLEPPRGIEAVIAAMERAPGIERVFRGTDLTGPLPDNDPIRRAAMLSYVPRLSGDLVLALKAGWMFVANGTTHGTAHPEDQRVPVVFMGRGIRPGVYREPVTPADVAPTLATLAGIDMPRAEGRALTMALEP